MDSILFTDQYKTKPAANPARIKVKTNGKNLKILACVGSVGAGLSFCCNHIVKPIKIGSIPMLTIDKMPVHPTELFQTTLKRPMDQGQISHVSIHKMGHGTFLSCKKELCIMKRK